MNKSSPPVEVSSSAQLGAVRDWHMHDGVFVNRSPEGAARQLAIVLASATEWNLATLERMKMRKATTKYDLARQQKICDDMVAQCRDLRIGASGLRGHLCGRLLELLQAPNV